MSEEPACKKPTQPPCWKLLPIKAQSGTIEAMTDPEAQEAWEQAHPDLVKELDELATTEPIGMDPDEG